MGSEMCIRDRRDSVYFVNFVTVVYVDEIITHVAAQRNAIDPLGF